MVSQAVKVINKEGIDVTNNYNVGANLALEKALDNNCKIAILKAKSPSCGSGKIYDGQIQYGALPDPRT